MATASDSDFSKSGPQATGSKRPIADILSETFPPYDDQTELVTPFDNETKRDTEFLEKLNSMLLELIIEFHAWSSARPIHESDKMADVLEKEIKGLRNIESEQGTSFAPAHPSILFASPSVVEKTRRRLYEFITRIKLALAALTGLAS
ncbi:hypothetical protein BD311DRAFT_727575 [Dichomitus squalens]|uniref:Uncharacterized protein n=1 Tax=Dichomitus squalens TaxID=114155 RepID=A0A4Q9MHK2_9APHY|nr:hypothetical protein BD311DRAFT_727575 [Dichomitus squalens]